MTYGITVTYFEESNGKKFVYEQYREFKHLGKAAKKWVNKFHNTFPDCPFNMKVHNVRVMNEKAQTVKFDWGVK